MRRLSEGAVELLRELQKPPTFLQRFGVRSDEKSRIIDLLGDSAEIGVVPYLGRFLFESEELSKVAQGAIAKLVRGASSSDLTFLEDAMRRYYPSWGWKEFGRVDQQSVRSLDIIAEYSVAVFGAISCHQNGFVRQAAVQQLSLTRDGSEVPFLLIRLNDWVEPIRAESRELIIDRLRVRSFAGFAKHIDLVFRLDECHRDDHRPVVAAIIDWLSQPSSADTVYSIFTSANRASRRKCYRALLDREGAHRVRVIQMAAKCQDAALRIWATRDATKSLNIEDLGEILPALSEDRFMPVRREALVSKTLRYPEVAREAFVNALLDSSYGIRSFAAFHLRDTDFNIAQFYRESLLNQQSIPAAIAGLGETGSEADVGQLLPFLTSTQPKVRAAAIRSLGRVGKSEPVGLFLTALRDASRVVIEEARVALESRIDELQTSDLCLVMREASRNSVQLAVLRLLDAMPLWKALPCLIWASANAASLVAQRARLRIWNSMNRVFTSPNEQQLEAINVEFEQSAALLPVDFRTDLQKWLDSRSSRLSQ